jgi:hypothetical protein
MLCDALQVFFPFAPGIETIYEPAMEEVEEALDAARENLDHMQVSCCHAMYCFSFRALCDSNDPAAMQVALIAANAR